MAIFCFFVCSLFVFLVSWLASWLVGLLVGYLVRLAVSFPVFSFVGLGMVGSSVCRLDDWLIGW